MTKIYDRSMEYQCVGIDLMRKRYKAGTKFYINGDEVSKKDYKILLKMDKELLFARYTEATEVWNGEASTKIFIFSDIYFKLCKQSVTLHDKSRSIYRIAKLEKLAGDLRDKVFIALLVNDRPALTHLYGLKEEKRIYL